MGLLILGSFWCLRRTGLTPFRVITSAMKMDSVVVETITAFQSSCRVVANLFYHEEQEEHEDLAAKMQTVIAALTQPTMEIAS